MIQEPWWCGSLVASCRIACDSIFFLARLFNIAHRFGTALNSNCLVRLLTVLTTNCSISTQSFWAFQSRSLPLSLSLSFFLSLSGPPSSSRLQPSLLGTISLGLRHDFHVSVWAVATSLHCLDILFAGVMPDTLSLGQSYQSLSYSVDALQFCKAQTKSTASKAVR